MENQNIIRTINERLGRIADDLRTNPEDVLMKLELIEEELPLIRDDPFRGTDFEKFKQMNPDLNYP